METVVLYRSSFDLLERVFLLELGIRVVDTMFMVLVGDLSKVFRLCPIFLHVFLSCVQHS